MPPPESHASLTDKEKDLLDEVFQSSSAFSRDTTILRGKKLPI
jgi:hypothetical protein